MLLFIIQRVPLSPTELGKSGFYKNIVNTLFLLFTRTFFVLFKELKWLVKSQELLEGRGSALPGCMQRLAKHRRLAGL